MPTAVWVEAVGGIGRLQPWLRRVSVPDRLRVGVPVGQGPDPGVDLDALDLAGRAPSRMAAEREDRHWQRDAAAGNDARVHGSEIRLDRRRGTIDLQIVHPRQNTHVEWPGRMDQLIHAPQDLRNRGPPTCTAKDHVLLAQ